MNFLITYSVIKKLCSNNWIYLLKRMRFFWKIKVHEKDPNIVEKYKYRSNYNGKKPVLEGFLILKLKLKRISQRTNIYPFENPFCKLVWSLSLLKWHHRQLLGPIRPHCYLFSPHNSYSSSRHSLNWNLMCKNFHKLFFYWNQLKL